MLRPLQLDRQPTNPSRALIGSLRALTVTQGRRTGAPFTVLPSQRRFGRSAFAGDVQSAALPVCRGNCKTALLGRIAAATLDGHLAVPKCETAIVASSLDQARIAFEHVRVFMGDRLRGRERWRVWDTAQQAGIEILTGGDRARCIDSDPHRTPAPAMRQTRAATDRHAATPARGRAEP